MVERVGTTAWTAWTAALTSSGGATEPDARRCSRRQKNGCVREGGGEGSRRGRARATVNLRRTLNARLQHPSERADGEVLRVRQRGAPPRRALHRGRGEGDRRHVTNVRHRLRRAAEGERRRAGRDATRGARDLETARRARALANAKTTVCVGRARVALLRPTPRNGQVGNSPVGRTKRVSRAPCRVWMKKKQKAVQAQSAKTEIEKTRQFCRCCFLCEFGGACFEEGTKTVFF